MAAVNAESVASSLTPGALIVSPDPVLAEIGRQHEGDGGTPGSGPRRTSVILTWRGAVATPHGALHRRLGRGRCPGAIREAAETIDQLTRRFEAVLLAPALAPVRA